MPSGNGEKFTAVRPSIVFGLLQHSLLPLGYKLTESSRDRVGNVVAASVGRFWKKIQAITDGKRRKRIKAETWIKVGIKPDEVQCTPNHIMAELESDDNFLTKFYFKQKTISTSTMGRLQVLEEKMFNQTFIQFLFMLYK